MAWKQAPAFRILLLVTALGVVSLVGTILVVPTYKRYTCSVGTFCEGPAAYNGAKFLLILLEALVIVASSFAAAVLWSERKWSDDIPAPRP